MIQPNELRIGNYVAHADGTICQLSEICTPAMYVIDQEGGKFLARVDDLSPVALTPEWLEACGFEKDGFGAYNLSISPNPEYLLKQLSFSWDYLFLREGNLKQRREKDDIAVLWNNDYRGNPQLHQLQNLFFALTGEELTIKQAV